MHVCIYLLLNVSCHTTTFADRMRYFEENINITIAVSVDLFKLRQEPLGWLDISSVSYKKITLSLQCVIKGVNIQLQIIRKMEDMFTISQPDEYVQYSCFS